MVFRYIVGAMRLFWRPKRDSSVESRVKKASLLEGLETLQELWDQVRQLNKDMAIYNTALNRIERKQSRWIEIINRGEHFPNEGKEDSPLDINPPAEVLKPKVELDLEAVGEELKNFVPFF